MITIFVTDEFAKRPLEQALAQLDLAHECCIRAGEDPDEVCIASDAYAEIRENDRFSRPVRLGLVLDRIQKHLGADQNQKKEDLSLGPYVLRDSSNDLKDTRTGGHIRLTDKEKNILEFLAAQDGEMVERKALLDEVWGYADTVETHTLETHIYRLRQKIEDDPAAPKILLTKDNGYALGV